MVLGIPIWFGLSAFSLSGACTLVTGCCSPCCSQWKCRRRAVKTDWAPRRPACCYTEVRPVTQHQAGSFMPPPFIYFYFCSNLPLNCFYGLPIYFYVSTSISHVEMKKDWRWITDCKGSWDRYGDRGSHLGSIHVARLRATCLPSPGLGL